MPKNNHSEFMRCYKKYVAVFKRKGKPKKSDTVALIDEFNLYPDLDDKENKAKSDEKKYKKFLRTIKYNNLEIFNTWADRAIREYMDTHPPQTVDEVNTSIAKLSKQVHQTPHTIRNTINRSGLNPFYKESPERQKKRDTALKLYRDGNSPETIAAELSVTRLQVTRYLTEQGVSIEELSQFNGNSKYDLRDMLSFTLENAHLWGLIWSDGSISSNTAVIIRLTKKDHEYLNAMSQSIAQDKSPHYPIHMVREKRNRKGYENAQDCYQLNISQKYFVTQIHELGMPFNKNETDLSIPEMIKTASNEYFFEFLRGFLEGDGGFTRNKTTPHITFAVDLQFAGELAVEILKRIGITGSEPIKDKSIYRLSYAGTPKVMLLIMYIYRNAGVVMQRKADKARSFIHEFACGLHTEDRLELTKTLSIADSERFNLIVSVLKANLKDRNAILHFENVEDGRIERVVRKDVEEKLGITAQGLSKLKVGDRSSVNGWKLVDSDTHSQAVLDYRNAWSDNIICLKKGLDVFKGPLYDFLITHRECSLEGIRRLQRGERQSHQGWSLY